MMLILKWCCPKFLKKRLWMTSRKINCTEIGQPDTDCIVTERAAPATY